MQKQLIFLLLILTTCHAKLSEDYNLFNNNSAPLFSFGQNIIRKKALWTVPYFYYTKSSNDTSLFQFSPQILYGITDWVSIFITTFVDKLKRPGQKVVGTEDLLTQFEWALYQNGTKDHYSLISLVTGLYFPIANKNLDRRKLHAFLGSTQSFLTSDWYLFTSQGYFHPVTRKETRFGQQLFFQFGLGRTLYNTKNLFIALLGELDGEAISKNKVNKIDDVNTGGTAIFAGPVLQISNQFLIFQIGIQAPIHQRLNGTQPKVRYIFGTGLTYYKQF